MPLNKDSGNVLDLVEIKEIRQSTVLMKNGSLRQIVMVGGTNFSLKSEDEQNIITQAYQNFLNSINFSIQIIIHSRKINIERYVARLDESRNKESSGLLREQINEYQQFVRGFITDNPIMAKTFLVVVPYTPVNLPSLTSSSSFLSALPFFGKKKTEEETKKTSDEQLAAERKSFDEHYEQLRQRTSQVVQGLSTIGLEAVALNDEQLIELFYNFYNPETVERREVELKK